jgi:hypothetical protein
MNAPEFTSAPNIPVSNRENHPAPSCHEGSGLDDAAALFPGMEVFHDLRISGSQDWQLLASVSKEVGSKGAKIVSLSLRRSDDGQSWIRCRLAGLASREADSITRRLIRETCVTSARVEHVILRSE